MSPFLAVIIVAYRSREEIGAAVGSLPREIRGRRVEVVVVDNSLDTDGTGALVREAYPWVDYTAPTANLRFGRANNFAVWRTTVDCERFLSSESRG